MYNRKYYKKYVILDCETRGFGLWGRVPTGTCLMEIKGGKALVALVLQGLVPNLEGRYELYFIFGDNGKYEGLGLCEVSVSDIGTVRLKHSFDPDNINETGFMAEDIKGVAVISHDDRSGGERVEAPLCGYFYDRMDWRNNFSVIGIEKEALCDKYEDLPRDEVSEGVMPVVVENNERKQVYSKEEMPLKEIKLDSFENHEDNLNAGINLIWEYAEKIKPFDDNIPVEWARINIRQTSCLPLENKRAINAPVVLLSYKKGGYFILGRSKGTSCDRIILLGVPSEYKASYEGEFNQAGFYYFKPQRAVEAEEGTEGYWLLSIE